MSAVHMVGYGVLGINSASFTSNEPEVEVLLLVRQQLAALGIPLHVDTGFKHGHVTYTWTARAPVTKPIASAWQASMGGDIITSGSDFRELCREIADYLDRNGYTGSTDPLPPLPNEVT